MTAPLPPLPEIIVEAGLVPDSPVQAGGTLRLDDAAHGLLDTATLGTAITWTDISQWVRSFTITRPSTRQQGPLYQFQAGTASITLDNSDGRFDPGNLAGPYVSAGVTQLTAMVPVRIRAAWAGTAYGLYSGFSDGWLPAQVTYEGGYAEVTLPATDAFKVLAGIQLAQLGSPEGAGADTGARVADILSRAGWYTDRRAVGTGSSSLQATSLGADALSLMQLAVDSEIGQLYVSGAGAVTFRARHALLQDARSATVQAVFGDLPGTLVPEVCSQPALNANPGFDNGIANWAGGHGAVIAYSTDWQYGPRPGVMSLHGDGVTANPRATSFNTGGITPLAVYTLFAVTFTPVASGVFLQADWKDSGATFISSSLSATVTTASPWQVLTLTATAPAGAATVTIIPTLAGTPAAAVMLYVGYASVIAGDASSAAAELACAAVQRASDDTTIANDVQATRAGGTVQEVQDAASIAKYLFPRSYARSDLILQGDSDALNWAQWVLHVSSGGEDRIESLAADPQADPAGLWPQVLGREVGDRVQVWHRPAGVTSPLARDCLIAGITHSWDSVTCAWLTTWALQDAGKYGSFLTLDNPTNGRLDNNALTF